MADERPILTLRVLIPDLRIFPRDPWVASWSVACAILYVTALVVVVDQLWRGALTPGYLAFWTQGGLRDRMAMDVLLSVKDEVVWRLGAMTLLALIGTWMVRGRLPAWAMLWIIVMNQFWNIAHLIDPQPVYWLFRYLLPGCVWGWLYWRQGWLAALAGHVGCHLVLDPIQAVLL